MKRRFYCIVASLICLYVGVCALMVVIMPVLMTVNMGLVAVVIAGFYFGGVLICYAFFNT